MESRDTYFTEDLKTALQSMFKTTAHIFSVLRIKSRNRTTKTSNYTTLGDVSHYRDPCLDVFIAVLFTIAGEIEGK